MIENVIVTKTGQEADNTQKTIFSTNTPWENNGSNLVVYLNKAPLDKNNYTIIDSWRLQFQSPLKTTDEIQFIITKLGISFQAQVDKFNKKIEGKTQTSLLKKEYEETIPSKIITHSDEIWSSTIPSSPQTAVSNGVVQVLSLKELTQDTTVPGRKGWYASSNGFLSGRIKDWVPSRFGQAYHIRLFDADGKEIVSSDKIDWSWDYASGYLTILNSHNYKTPFKVTGFQYIGGYGVDLDGISQWKNPIPSFGQLPTEGNTQGDARIVLDDNSLWRWDSLKSIWIKMVSSIMKDSVTTFADLSAVISYPGDIRLVDDESMFYKYTLTGWEKILFSHNHDERYYTENEISQILTRYSPSSHVHDSLYYRQYEVTNMVRWRVSAATEADLPEWTSSRDGDVVLVRSTNTIYRWDPNKLPLGKWVAIISGNLTWKMPVQTIALLPTVDNNTGDVRIVLEKKEAYMWDGTQWLPFTNKVHNHDDRYYTESEINVMVRWLPPVANISLLPLSNNTDGDIRLTLDNNAIYRWKGSSWINISASNTWRDPVDLFTDLPIMGNKEGDTRIAKDTLLIYIWDNNYNIWNVVSNPPHNHNDSYYTKSELDSGQLDNRYYTENEINAMFNINTGHNHDGTDSARIDYNDLLNIPYFYWKKPVATYASLPIIGNTTGDARITLNENGLYVWTGVNWNLVNSGLFAPMNHNHDERYYREDEINNIISNLQLWVTDLLLEKANVIHNHDERYYKKEDIDQEFDDRFDKDLGHDHDGVNSKRISYYNLEDVPPLNAHTHDDLYYRKTELATPGEAEVHWENVASKPDLANGHWKSPVQTFQDLPATNNELYDIRIVLNDSDIYEWSGTEWIYVGHWDNQYVNYWREPVETYNSLPLVNNVRGDIRLVISDNSLYRWDDEIKRWVVLSSNKTNVQIYQNGLHLVQKVEWLRTKEKAVELLTPAFGGDRITLIINGDYYIRKDFVAWQGQTIFELSNEYYRQDWVVQQNQMVFMLDKNYIMNAKNLVIWWNGLLQRKGKDYIESSPNSFTFNHIIYPEDHVIAIIMDQASGEGTYVIEDQQATSGQTVFNLENFYIPGSKTLLVYFNGDLLKPGDDYYETSNSTIELRAISATTEDTLSFIIFGNGIGGGCCNAKDIILGTPTDGAWSDGLLYLFDEMKLNDSIDDINEVLKDIAPEAPTTFDNLPLDKNGLSLFSGYVSNNNINYETGYGQTGAGQYQNYLTESQSFYLYSPNDTCFGDADKGTITLYLNGVIIDSFRLYAAFVEDNASASQTSISYGQLFSGARENEGITGTDGALRNSMNGYISIMNVGIYNNFKMWQKGRIRINITPGTLRQGYNSIYIVHKSANFNRKSVALKLFLDTANARPYLAQQTILENTYLISSKYCSGIRYYSIGDRFNVRFTGIGIFNNTFAMAPVELDMPGLQPYEIEWNHEDITGPQNPPRLGDLFNFNGEIILNEYNEYDSNAIMTITTKDPFGSGATTTTTPVNRLINTFTNGSSDLIEFFRDEIYRLPAGDYNSIPSIRVNAWNSQNLLQSGNAMLFNRKLKYANLNFSNYTPPQTANYSGFTGPQTYYRSFYKHAAKNGGIIQINGVTIQDITSNRVLIDIKLPAKTGWLSLNKNYDVSVFTGSDGNGCLLKVDGNNYYYSSGTFSTASSGYMVVVRITLPNSNIPEIEYMEMKW